MILSLKNQTYNPPRVITGERFDSVMLRNVSGLSFVDCEIVQTGKTNVFVATGCSDISISGGHIEGTPDLILNGITLTNCKRVAIDGVKVRLCKRGIVIGGCEDVDVSRCLLTELRSDGIDVGTSKRVTIANNTIADFTIAPGDHPDAIQIILAAVGALSSDITITGNSIFAAAQGITCFSHDRGVTENVTVTNNYICCLGPHGITMSQLGNSRVTDNVLARHPSATKRPYVTVSGTGNVVERNREPLN